MIQQCRTYSQRRFAPHLCGFRLPCPVPVFERRFEISFKEIDRGQKFIGVDIFGIEPQGAMQIASGLSVILPFERYAGQFDGKAFIVRSQTLAGGKCSARFYPVLQMRQRDTVVIIQVSRVTRRLLQKLYKLGPALVFKKLPGCWRGISLRRVSQIKAWQTEGGQTAERCYQKHGSPKNFYETNHLGSASNVQCPTALHCFSKLARSCLSSLRCAASFK